MAISYKKLWKLLIDKDIPAYFGFDDADSFMRSFISHLEEMSIETIEEIISVYKKNSQCTNRSRHASDMVVVN